MIILEIGSHSFAIPSAAIASAICDVLGSAPQVRFTKVTGPEKNWRYGMQEGPRSIAHFKVRAVSEGQLEGIPTIPARPVCEAVLGEESESRRRTHQILTAAAGEHTRAIAATVQA